MDKMYDWFSVKQSKYGVYEYENTEGKKVLVTVITHTPENTGTKFDDLRCVGELTKYVRTVPDSKTPLNNLF